MLSRWTRWFWLAVAQQQRYPPNSSCGLDHLPTIQLVTGPMSTSRYQSERLGACTDCRRFPARYRAERSLTVKLTP